MAHGPKSVVIVFKTPGICVQATGWPMSRNHSTAIREKED
jgi:hypothetical protein